MDGWMSWQSGLNLRQPYRPKDTYIRLVFTAFLSHSQPKRVLSIGLGGGIWSLLVQHYFPAVIIDIVEIDQTVIRLAEEYFGLEPQTTINIIADDGYHYVTETAYRYDMIFLDAFLEDTIPSHINTREFVIHLHRILTDHGCLITNVNVSSSAVFNRMIENARVIISGNELSLKSFSSKTQTIQQAERFEMKTHLEFSLSSLLSLANVDLS